MTDSDTVTLTYDEIVWLRENVGPGQTVQVEPDPARAFRMFQIQSNLSSSSSVEV